MRIDVQDLESQRIIDRGFDAGQGHVFRFWSELDEAGRRALLAQLAEIDFALLRRLTDEFIRPGASPLAEKRLEPAEFIPVPRTPEQHRAADAAKQTGEQALRQGRVAAFLVAGGQGTRLGFDGPKGMYPISPVKNKTLFQLHAEKLLALSRRHGATIPWYIMTSATNDAETRAFFEQHDFFGLAREDVVFFQQAMVPALDENGKLFLDRKDHVFENPNGHGGSLAALKQSGALQDMRDRGIDLIFYFQVDNVLVKICDPVFLGFHLQNEAEMSAKVVEKIDPSEKVGVVGRIDGELGVIEYSDLPEAEKRARNPDGSLKFRGGSIAIHVLDVAFVERENEGGLRLPWHVAHKKIPHLDEQGNLVEPAEPNGYKFETFVFDALRDARRAMFLEVPREEEFSPVKNAEGVDSPSTARRDMVNLFASWLEKAGVTVPRNGDGTCKTPIEVSPLYALDAEELRQKLPADLKLDGQPLYLG
ncbi:MAG: UDPGP type 1 family protein [Calditrichaeota bacterium]|nr:MAG: UDPGP type 1 family protein [Calditrichota bacterium]